jgi:hypothetical protein
VSSKTSISHLLIVKDHRPAVVPGAARAIWHEFLHDHVAGERAPSGALVGVERVDEERDDLAVSPEVWVPARGRVDQPALGTFDTDASAPAELGTIVFRQEDTRPRAIPNPTPSRLTW